MSRDNVYVTPYSSSTSKVPVNPYPINTYPVNTYTPSFPVIQPVYIPNVGSNKINRAVSVIAILLIIALLFVGMQLLNGNGIVKNNVTWVMGYIDEHGEAVPLKGKASNSFGDVIDNFMINTGFKTTVGMFTSEGIEVKTGVQIKKIFESHYLYEILCYDEDDSFIGCFGEPRSQDEQLNPKNFNGEFRRTKYIRLYVYPKDNGSFSSRDWKRAQRDFEIYTVLLNN